MSVIAVMAAYAVIVPGGAARSAAATAAPVLVVTDLADPFGQYYAEILRAEGLNAFDVANLAGVTPDDLESREVVVLARTAISDAQVTMLTDWVGNGGNLIAMRPDAKLAGLLGLGTVTGDLSNGYLTSDPTSPAGTGITADSMQFHGTADRWTVAGAVPVARLSSTATGTPDDPAVTMRAVGISGGQAAAFTFDLARSIVYTRQGNPAWAGQERDAEVESTGQPPLIRSNDLFYGAKPGDVQPDWVDFTKIQIPQADEQQRLLANLITRMSADRLPMPRFWYLPRGLKAAVIMTGDDHAVGGTKGQFDWLYDTIPPGECSVAEWTCLRSTSYMYPITTLTDAEIAGYREKGFEISLHTSTKPPTSCDNYTESALRGFWDTQAAALKTARPNVASFRTTRTHCVAWSDWASQPKVEAAVGVGLDTNYYYWPRAWVKDRPGLFTGSGLPMRFADLDGTPIDVYQAATQMTDDSEITYTRHADTLLDNALGTKGYYGVFTANMHTDLNVHPGMEAIVASARARSVPVIAAEQMLDWLDGRNGSSFESIDYSAGRLRFSVSTAAGSAGLQAMLPVAGPTGPLLALGRGDVDVPTTKRTVKGVEYAVFDAEAGEYSATYSVPTPAPTETATPGAQPTPPASSSPEAVRPSPTQAPGGKTTTPVLKVGPTKVRASRQGVVVLRVSCSGCASTLKLQLRLRVGRRDVASRTVSVAPGAAKSVKLTLTSAAKRQLSQKGSLVATALATTKHAGKSLTSRTTVRLAAPR
jgi:hypothetical protein